MTASELPSRVETAFQRAREELEIRSAFPDDVLRQAEQVAQRVATAANGRVDATAVAFCTVDPPGSRDLDQAVHVERADDGYRVRYAIADVGFWVDRGSAIEQEAWRRGVTFYAPDERQPLYPPVLSQGAASLLPDHASPAIMFTLDLNARAEPRHTAVERALVRSRAQLTYTQLLAHGTGNPVSGLEPDVAETLSLLAEIGPKRLEREAERGGVSLPIRDQHVQQLAAARLGYKLVYEEPNAAEQWNAQISLLTGHLAALRMLEAGTGLLRTMPPLDERAIHKFRRIARAMGFNWPEEWTYPQFIHRLSLGHPNLDALVWQARRVMHGADYAAFDGEPPERREHAALAMPYAHVTAPLRRLADRYAIDLLIDLARDRAPTAENIATLRRLPPLMDEAQRKENRLERRVVDIAEAWTLRERVGDHFSAVVLDAQPRRFEVQVEDPPIRTRVDADADGLAPGDPVQLKLAHVDVAKGALRFERAD